MTLMNPKQLDDLHELCERLVEGKLTPAESQQLEALARASAPARRYIVEHLQIHAGLHWESGRIGQQTLPDQLAASLAGLESGTDSKIIAFESPWVRRAPWVALAASVVFLAAGIGLGLTYAKRQTVAVAAVAPGNNNTVPTVATLTQTRACRWESSALPTAEGARLSAGKLSLTDGLATIRFDSGAVVTLEAPAELEIVHRDLCVLHRGMLTAHVPHEAIGFTVETTNAKIIDHGTDFGISAGITGQAHVQVFDGEVEVQHRQSGENVRLMTGENVLLNQQSLAARNANTTEAERAVRDVPDNAPATKDTVMLTTAAGLGRTSYIASPGTTNHHSQSLMLVKNTNTPGFRRKAYFSFDLASLRGKKVENAALSLAFEPSGYGFASRMPACSFTVYGLTDQTLDNWSESDLKWQNAPANLPGGGEVDTTKAVPLGTFSIAPEDTSGFRTISGPALVEFLSHDTNGQVSFILVRDTKEFVVSGQAPGIVHGFAGNYHPTAPPPTLRLNLADSK